MDGVDGAEGHIGLNGKDGMVDIWTKPGKPGVDGKDGETMTRIVYKDPDGKEHQGATLDDGLKFHGDSGDIVTRKLNTQLDVLGGQTDTTKLTATTDGNIGVVSTKAANETSNGKLEIRLAKELKGLTSVQTGDTTVNDDGLTINKAGQRAARIPLPSTRPPFPLRGTRSPTWAAALMVRNIPMMATTTAPISAM